MTGLMAFTFSAAAGICFFSGIAVLMGGKGESLMDGFGNFISMMDFILDTKRKRHITGGILLSASLLFGGLALTVMTINEGETNDNE